MNAGTVARAERTAVQRLRHVRSTAAAFPGLGLEIQDTPDGRKAVLLPAGLLDFFVEDLERRAAEWKEQARKARVVEMRRAAELQAATGEARREWEATADEWTATYLRFRESGQGHRAALRAIRGPKPDRKAFPQMCVVTLAVTEGLARRRVQRWADRDAAVCRLSKAGKSRADIADTLNLNYNTVSLVLQKAGITPAPGDRAAGVRKMTLGGISGTTGGR